MKITMPQSEERYRALVLDTLRKETANDCEHRVWEARREVWLEAVKIAMEIPVGTDDPRNLVHLNTVNT